MAAGRRCGDEERIKVGLLACGQSAGRVVQANDEGGDLSDGGAGVVDRRGQVGAGVGVGGPTQPGRQTPTDPGAQDTTVGLHAVTDGGGQFVGEPVEEPVRVDGQCLGGDEQGTQVFQVPAARLGVQRGVAAIEAAVVQVGEDRSGAGQGREG